MDNMQENGVSTALEKTSYLVNHISQVYSKRIARDCSNLFSCYPCIYGFSISKNTRNSGNSVNTGEKVEEINICSIRFGLGRFIYRFDLPERYPFAAPNIYINQQLYRSLLQLPNLLIPILKNMKGSDFSCLCCQSFGCKNNWNPAVSIASVMSEILRNMETKKMIVLMFLVEKIKNKYLNHDIDVMGWL
jgi:hypothetical protein